MSIRGFDLSGKIALVTGGAQNFGLEIAGALARAGAEVIVTSRDEAKAAQAAARLERDAGATVHGEVLDVLLEDSAVALLRRIRSRHRRLDVLVNNAGGHSAAATGRLETEPLSAWREYLDINLTGAFLMIRESAGLMMERRSGSIINIASVAAILGRDRRVYTGGMRPQPVPYAAAKAGILGLTYDAAGYLGAWGIRVNAISPGGFERGQPEPFVHAYSERTMLGRMGRDGEDLGGAALYLSADASAYVTGQNLVVDGGFTRFR